MQKVYRIYVDSSSILLPKGSVWFEPCVREAGIKHFTWHDLRHTFASRLVMVGVDLRTVQELLGHETVQMTIRYAHIAPSHRLKSVEKLLTLKNEHVEVTDTKLTQEGIPLLLSNKTNLH